MGNNKLQTEVETAALSYRESFNIDPDERGKSFLETKVTLRSRCV